MEVLIAVGVVLVLTVLIRIVTGRGERAPSTLPPSETDPATRRSMQRAVGGDAGVEEIAALIDRGRKIEAIKRYRERHGVGLREAKEAVERLARERRSAQRA